MTEDRLVEIETHSFRGGITRMCYSDFNWLITEIEQLRDENQRLKSPYCDKHNLKMNLVEWCELCDEENENMEWQR